MPRAIHLHYPALEDDTGPVVEFVDSPKADILANYRDEPVDYVNQSIDSVLESIDDAILNFSAGVSKPNQLVVEMYLITGARHSTDPMAALESLYDKAKEVIVSAYEHMLKFLQQIKGFFLKMFKGKDKSKIVTKEAQAKLQQLLNDPIDRKIDELLNLATKEVLEDYRPAQPNKLANIFTRFKDTLSDQEVDFLTSGTYYRNIQVLVRDWNDGKFPEFVTEIQSDIDRWTDAGLNQSKHVGRDARVVKEFRETMRVEADEIVNKHRKKFSAIRHLEETHQNLRTAGNLTRLHEFLNKPSALFPHVSNLWKVIQFETMTDSDRKLINELDRITGTFETRIKAMREHASVDKIIWPAEDAILQLCTKLNQDTLKAVSTLANISSILRKSAVTAFNATNKSFAYIRHILNLVKEMSTVNKDEVQRCLDSIDKRHKELEELVQY